MVVVLLVLPPCGISSMSRTLSITGGGSDAPCRIPPPSSPPPPLPSLRCSMLIHTRSPLVKEGRA